jgi:hypothetical protein
VIAELGKSFFSLSLFKKKFDFYRKTALLQRFAQDYFSTDYVTTIGVGEHSFLIIHIFDIFF